MELTPKNQLIFNEMIRKFIKVVEIYLEEGNLKKQLNYANVQGIPYVVIIGEDEASTGEMVVKNMTTGEQNKQMM